MTEIDPPVTSLARLVDGLVAHLSQHPKLQPSPPPDALKRVFESFGYHLVLLMLLAGSDDKVAASEREVILHHCLHRARKAGLNLSPKEENALNDYLHHFRPTPMQRISAEERLKREGSGGIAALIAAARNVVRADGVVYFREALDLDSLKHNLLAI